MTVTCHFGLTESGKSHHVQTVVLPQWQKKVVFDLAHCFSGDVVLNNPSDRDLERAAIHLASKSGFCCVVRPSRSGSDEVLFNKTVILAYTLGRLMGLRADPARRLQLVVDEADFICSPHYQSPQLKHIVNKGRHDNVDCHFIARNPNRLHTDIRVNCTKIVTFVLNNAASIEMFRSNFSRKIAERIEKLPKYHRLEWDTTGRIVHLDNNGKMIENFSNNSENKEVFSEENSSSKRHIFPGKKRISNL